MLSYRYMHMRMDGSLAGTDAVPNSEIVSPDGYGLMVTPENMTMRMHMFGAMFAPSDGITLMGMLPVLSNDMDHITRAGGAFTTESGGLGDVRVGALVGLADWGSQSLHANAMVSIPTGSIEEQAVLPTSNGTDVQLPYPMQVGSGTWDLLPGITWLGQAGAWSWGAQGGATFRRGENDRDWKFGNRGLGTLWFSRDFSPALSASLRMAGETWGDVDGVDPAPSVNPAVVPTARTDLRGGTRADLGLGHNHYIPRL
jgi:hypothetical protein